MFPYQSESASDAVINTDDCRKIIFFYGITTLLDPNIYHSPGLTFLSTDYQRKLTVIGDNATWVQQGHDTSRSSMMMI